ncbi:hypothetical protein F9278_41465 [Streptomyces phaeolivaceus]|uniref:Uncharacterized protein n=1 Tax=Streptomyces phaeolivaceus TaxID=2653200 RepID=A0A5P8KEK9_9ACTN|nr:hypothetical protein [Streptomyces phaeolivaceus]QFR01582.1 hypothetical protein F9278_41465 [Streptomyces phaeolivaceus]
MPEIVSKRSRRARWAVPAAAAVLVGLQIAGAGSAFAGRGDGAYVWRDRSGVRTVLEGQCFADGGSQLVSSGSTYDCRR